MADSVTFKGFWGRLTDWDRFLNIESEEVYQKLVPQYQLGRLYQNWFRGLHKLAQTEIGSS